MRRRRKTLLKLLGITALAAALLGLVGAMALAQPGGSSAEMAIDPEAAVAARAGQAAAALADAHPGDSAVVFLADTARRETALLAGAPRPELNPVLGEFAARAEEHLISPSRNPAEAQLLLRTLLQGLRGAQAAQPAPQAAPQPEHATETSAFGRNVVIEAGSIVEEASVVGGNLTVRGRVLGDAVAVGGNLRLEPGARVDGDAVSVGGNVELSPGARVEGDTVTVGGRISNAEGAWIGGDRTQVGTATWANGLPFASQEGRHGSRVLSWIGTFIKKLGVGLVMALLAIVIAALMPGRVKNVIATIRRRPVMSFLTGALSTVVVAVASFLLGITIIGAPLAALLLAAAALAALLGLTGVACLAGEAMPGRGKSYRSALRCIVLGMTLLTIVSLVPLGCFGWILGSLVVSLSLGGVILSRVGALEPQG
jgi:hypothetical protein